MRKSLFLIFLTFTILLTACQRTELFVTPENEYIVLNLKDELAILKNGKPLDTRIAIPDSVKNYPTSSYQRRHGDYVYVIFGMDFCRIDTRDMSGEWYEGTMSRMSDDGTSFAYMTGEGLTVRGESWETFLTTVDTPRNAFSPDGNLMFCRDEKAHLHVIGMLNGENLDADLGGFEGIAISDNADFVYISRTDDKTTELYLTSLTKSGSYSVDESELTHLGTVNDNIFVQYHYSTDRSELLYLTNSAELILLKNGEKIEISSGEIDFLMRAEIFPYDPPRTFVGMPMLYHQSGQSYASLGMITEQKDGITFVPLDDSDRVNSMEWMSAVHCPIITKSDFVWYTRFNDSDEYGYDLWRCELAPGAKPELIEENISDYRVTDDNWAYCQHLTQGERWWITAAQSGKSSREIDEEYWFERTAFKNTIFYSTIDYSYPIGERPKDLRSSEKGRPMKLVMSDIEDFSVHNTCVVVKKEIAGQTEYFISTDGKHFNQFFY